LPIAAIFLYCVMPKISLSVRHQLSQEEAKQRLARLAAEVRAKNSGHVTDIAESWNGYVDTFSFRALGFSVSGSVEVREAEVVVEMKVPLAALMFKSRVEREVLAHARQALE